MKEKQSDKNKDRKARELLYFLDISRRALDKIGASEEEIEKREKAFPHFVRFKQRRGSRGTRESFCGS